MDFCFPRTCGDLYEIQRGLTAMPVYSGRYVKTASLSILIFFLIYNISFKSFELLTTARIAILLLIFWVLSARINFINGLRSRILVLFLPLPYVAFQYLFVGDFGQLSRFVHLGIYSFLGAGLVVSICDDLRSLLIALLVAVCAQAVLILFSFFSVDYRVWFDAISVSGSNYDATYIYRAPGFAGTGGAALSLLQSLGVFLGWLLLRKNKIYKSVEGKSVYLVFFAMLLSALSCIVVGRTGLLLSFVFFAIFAFDSPSRNRFAIFFVVLFLLFQSFFLGAIPGLLDSEFSSDYFGEWAFGFLTGNDETISALGGQEIPPLSMEMIHGTGLNSVVDGANPSGHDSGFVQAYYSMGLPMSIIFFSAYLYVLFISLKWLPFSFRILFSILFFALEIKEPFVFKYSLMFVLLSLYFAHKRFGFPHSLIRKR